MLEIRPALDESTFLDIVESKAEHASLLPRLPRGLSNRDRWLIRPGEEKQPVLQEKEVCPQCGSQCVQCTGSDEIEGSFEWRHVVDTSVHDHYKCSKCEHEWKELKMI